MTLQSGVLSLFDLRWLWLTVAASFGGTLNAMAGGGSFVLFPALMGMKMLPIQANATNTVALWPGQVTSFAPHRNDIKQNLHLALPMGLASLIGGTVGAVVLLHTPQVTFLHLVPWLLLVASSIFAVSGPVSRFLARRRGVSDTPMTPPRRLPVFLSTIAVCFYIGYFGAGSGFLLITMLSLFGHRDMNEINALKIGATALANGVAFAIFAASGQVIWSCCLLAMLASAIGGYASASLARKVPQSVRRGLVIFVGFSMAAFFFWKGR
jgi:uncharacterized membrane protein YfcA